MFIIVANGANGAIITQVGVGGLTAVTHLLGIKVETFLSERKGKKR